MFSKIALKFFGGMIEPYIGYFEGLKLQLKRARMTVTVQEYLASVIFAAVLVFMASMIFGSFFISFFLPYIGYSYTLSIIVSFTLTALTILAGYIYPNLLAATVKAKIDRSLPFAAFYMTTSASSGMNPVEIFRILALRGGIIGQEAQKIYTNVKTLGMDIGTALQRAASRSPSPGWSDLLWGMASVISAGGDLENYLRTKTESLMAAHRRLLNEYAKTITLYTEIYITLIIVGSLFFIVLMSIISPMVGISVLYLQTFIVFFFIPLISIGFIVLLKSISPIE
jgi:archaellum biogenesis protein FlaJ (TadC family)